MSHSKEEFVRKYELDNCVDSLLKANLKVVELTKQLVAAEAERDRLLLVQKGTGDTIFELRKQLAAAEKELNRVLGVCYTLGERLARYTGRTVSSEIRSAEKPREDEL